MPRFDPNMVAEMTNLLTHHRAHPNVTVDEHLLTLEEDVAGQALSKTKVYLDLRYWIFFRDVVQGKPRKPTHSKLFDAIKQRVEDGNLICPITEAVFFELDRQSDTNSRMQTARLIDQLSKGFVIKNSGDRSHCEAVHLFDSIIGKQELPQHPCRNVWVRPYSFLGTPRLSGWDEGETLAINKAFMSYMWTRSLEDLLTDTPVPDSTEDDKQRDLARTITESSARHSSEMKSFAQVYEQEICGLLDSHTRELTHAYKPHLRSMLPAGFDPNMVEQRDVEKWSLTLAASVMLDKKPNIALPTIRILAGLHAFIRWQKKQEFKFTDFFDIRHATAAVPYCDVFLTERNLRHACTSNLLDFGTRYTTRIVSDEEEALKTIEELAS